MWKFGIDVTVGDLDLEAVVSAESIEEAIVHIRSIFKETICIKRVVLMPENTYYKE